MTLSADRPSAPAVFPPPTVRAIARLLDLLDRGVRLVALMLLVEIIITVFAGVIARYVFNASFSWTEELASWSFIWLIFTGVAAGHRGERHITVSMIDGALSPRWGAGVAFLVDLIVAYTTVMLLFGGEKLVRSIGGTSTALQWPNYVKYAIIPASCAVSLVYLLLGRVAERGPWSVVTAAAAIALAFALYATTSATSGSPFPEASPSLIMGVAFGIALVIGVPIGFAMLFSVFLSTWGVNLLPIAGVVHSMVSGASPFVLLAIPFFLSAGYLMNLGGLSARIIDFASVLVGHWRGGLAQANVLHSVMLGGICGSSGADAASTTKILVPEMIRRGYSPAFACAITAVGSILPSCFPPSIALLIYAAVAEVSVAQLFTAGILPGLLLAVLMMIAVHFVSTKRDYERGKSRASIADISRAGLRAVPAFMLILLILGLLRFGVVTATEVGVIAVLWALLLGKFAYRIFTWREFFDEMAECAVDTALIGFLIAVSVPFAWVLIAEQVPQVLVEWTKRFVSEPWQLLLLINILMLIAGTFLEVVPIMLIMVPLFVPVMLAVGVDPIHLGIIIVINSVLGSLTPPVGILVFICASIAKVPANAVFRECNPFLFACGIGLLVITYVPALSLTLWKLIGH
ncbi:MAG TPA: TRAP transporter large permease subunit [Casimicrobiaceae bacterium]|nr:TRAP transporter large permease subunit [Casimicrobiaceae bacterium]